MDITIAGISLYYIISWFFIYSFFRLGMGIRICICEKRKTRKQRIYQWPTVYYLWRRCSQCISDF